MNENNKKQEQCTAKTRAKKRKEQREIQKSKPKTKNLDFELDSINLLMQPLMLL